MSEETTIHFIAGLPRSGSTLLANILAQNPRFRTSATSGILEILFAVRNLWDNVLEFKASADREANEAAKLRALKAILRSYYENEARPVVFDKSRSWLAHLELAETLLGRPAKVLVPVRDIRDVLASFEKIWRTTARLSQISQEAKFYTEFQSIEGRCSIWLRPDQPVGIAYNRVRDAIVRGYRDRMHFVPYEALTAHPRETIEQIYQFLDEPAFPHDFQRVEQVTWEDDAVYGIKDLHKIRNQVEPMPSQWHAIIGEFANRFANMNFW